MPGFGGFYKEKRKNKKRARIQKVIFQRSYLRDAEIISKKKKDW